MSYLSGLGDRLNNTKEEQSVRKIDIELLVPSTKNFYGIREVEELAESIKESGLLHNLVVRDLKNGKYEILSGERRYRALKLIGAKRVMCQVKDISDSDAELLLIKANAEQRELTPSEKMEGIKRLEAIYKEKKARGEQIPKGKLRDTIGKDMGLSGTQVQRYKTVDKKLIEPLKEKLDNGDITLNQAETLTRLDKEEQKAMDNQLNSLSPAAKEEKEILIQGIKQPVKKEEVELIQELDKNKIAEEHEEIMEELNKFLESDKFPRLVISTKEMQSILGTSDIRYQEGYLRIALSGFGRTNVIKVKFKCFKSVKLIEGIGLKPHCAYQIADGIYLWFKDLGIRMKEYEEG